MFWTAFILGFAGSLHCMGMCSPLAMAVTSMSPNMMLSRLLYNGGRIFTYGLFGGIVASIGLAFPLMRYQNLLSILLGVALLVFGFAGISSIKIPFFTRAMGGISLLVKKQFSKYLQRKSSSSTFLLGSLNGFLPCGLSFLALTYCITLPGPIDGFGFMLMFGLGTLPAMLGFTSVFHWTANRFKVTAQKLTTIMLIVSGALLMTRPFMVHSPERASSYDSMVDIVICR